MKTTFVSIVLNEEEYLGKNLEQHYAFCDRWIIVEGADRRYPRADEDGLSVDRTAEIVRSFPDPDKKIEFIQHGWAADKSELRNRYAEKIEGGDDNAVVVFDADEFLRNEHLMDLLLMLNQLPRSGTIRLPHIHFWKQSTRIIRGGYYDVPHDRAYRWAEGARYGADHNHPLLPCGGRVRDISGFEVPRVLHTVGDELTIGSAAWLHYGFVKSAANITDKNAYYVNRGELLSRPGTTRDRAAWFAEAAPPGCQVDQWAGPWPEVFE